MGAEGKEEKREKGGRRTYCRGGDELAVESEEGMVIEDLGAQLASAEGTGDEGDYVGID